MRPTPHPHQSAPDCPGPAPTGSSDRPHAARPSVPDVSALRHRAEIPLLVGCAVVTVVGVGAAAAAVVSGLTVPTWALLAVAGLSLPVVAGVVIIRWTYWRQIANGVEITGQVLPEIHTIHADLVARLRLGHMPRVYVANGNGTVNALASKCRIRHGYVVLSSDLVDIGYEHGDLATIRFVLAHELAHIKCGHVNLWRTGITALPRLLRLDRSLTRAQEYTADRTAACLAPEGARGMLALYAGKRVYRHIDFDAYLQSVGNHRDGFWLGLVNLLSDHAVGFRRLTALANCSSDAKGWDTHGRML